MRLTDWDKGLTIWGQIWDCCKTHQNHPPIAGCNLFRRSPSAVTNQHRRRKGAPGLGKVMPSWRAGTAARCNKDVGYEVQHRPRATRCDRGDEDRKSLIWQDLVVLRAPKLHWH